MFFSIFMSGKAGAKLTLLLRIQEGRISRNMHIVLLDDSIPFDGATPSLEPLGGSQKAFVFLAEALSRRGHRITAINRCTEKVDINGVFWQPWNEARPSYADLLIAFQKPELLGHIEVVSRRLLWFLKPADWLSEATAHGLIMRFFPSIAFMGEKQVGNWKVPKGIIARIINPAAAEAFRSVDALCPLSPPQAIATQHPLQLKPLIRLWKNFIQPRCPSAELIFFSVLLMRAKQKEDVVESYKSILQDAEDAGITVKMPSNDEEMANAYRKARVHLYPGSHEEMLCSTLVETQATGLPAIAFDRGGVADRIEDGLTGYIAPDEEAFVNLAVRFLSEEEFFWTATQDAVMYQKQRSWDDVALEFESLWCLTQ